MREVGRDRRRIASECAESSMSDAAHFSIDMELEVCMRRDGMTYERLVLWTLAGMVVSASTVCMLPAAQKAQPAAPSTSTAAPPASAAANPSQDRPGLVPLPSSAGNGEPAPSVEVSTAAVHAGRRAAAPA